MICCTPVEHVELVEQHQNGVRSLRPFPGLARETPKRLESSCVLTAIHRHDDDPGRHAVPLGEAAACDLADVSLTHRECREVAKGGRDPGDVLAAPHHGAWSRSELTAGDLAHVAESLS